jgi:hypothetical protein
MDGYIVQGGLDVARGSFARIEDGEGLLLYVRDGGLWITQERDSRDYYVKPGDWFRIDRHGVVLACALSRSRVSLYEPARRPGGWKRAARQRLARFWANAFAPNSRPTSAAL